MVDFHVKALYILTVDCRNMAFSDGNPDGSNIASYWNIACLAAYSILIFEEKFESEIVRL